MATSCNILIYGNARAPRGGMSLDFAAEMNLAELLAAKDRLADCHVAIQIARDSAQNNLADGDDVFIPERPLWEGPRRFTLAAIGPSGITSRTGRAPPPKERNVLSSAGLAGFLEWALGPRQPARNVLVLWGHGDGPTGTVLLVDPRPPPRLTPKRVVRALRRRFSDSPLDVLGIDGCMNATIELACELAPYAKVLVASQTTIPARGWNYSAWPLVVAQAQDELELGQGLVDCYAKQGFSTSSISAVDTRQIGPLLTAIGNFSTLALSSPKHLSVLRDMGSDHAFRLAAYGVGDQLVDIASLFAAIQKNAQSNADDPLTTAAAQVVQGLGSAVTMRPFAAENVRGPGLEWSGLSIYFPDPARINTPYRSANLASYLDDPEELSRFKELTRWHEVIGQVVAQA